MDHDLQASGYWQLPSQVGSFVDLELIQVQVLFRHGARAPFRDSPDALDIWKTQFRADMTNAPSIMIALFDIEEGTPVPQTAARNLNAGGPGCIVECPTCRAQRPITVLERSGGLNLIWISRRPVTVTVT